MKKVNTMNKILLSSVVFASLFGCTAQKKSNGSVELQFKTVKSLNHLKAAQVAVTDFTYLSLYITCEKNAPVTQKFGTGATKIALEIEPDRNCVVNAVGMITTPAEETGTTEKKTQILYGKSAPATFESGKSYSVEVDFDLSTATEYKETPLLAQVFNSKGVPLYSKNISLKRKPDGFIFQDLYQTDSNGVFYGGIWPDMNATFDLIVDGEVVSKDVNFQNSKGTDYSFNSYTPDDYSDLKIAIGNFGHPLPTDWDSKDDNNNGKTNQREILDGKSPFDGTPIYDILTRKSNNPKLSAMTPSSGALVPAFNSLVTSYTLNVENSVSNLKLNSVLQQSKGKIKVKMGNGQYTEVQSGVDSLPLDLSYGANNSISILVTAENGRDTKEYILTVTRTLSNNANLGSLGLSTGTLVPAFSAGTLSYTVELPYSTSSIQFSPASENGLSTLKVNGVSVTSGSASAALSLSVGDNVIPVEVLAQDGVTAKTYTVTVRRKSNDATLSALTLSGITLSPGFTSNGTSYSVDVPYATSSTIVTPTRHHDRASITVNNVSVASGVASSSIPLNVGNNTITVVVTGEDTTSTKTYTLNIHRKSNDVSLLSLSLSGVTFSPSFSANTTSYTANVEYVTSSTAVTPTLPANSPATIKVNNVSVASGSASSSISLNTGNNVINTVVTAEDPTYTRTYTVTVTRNQSLAIIILGNSETGTFGDWVLGSTALSKTYTIRNSGNHTATSVQVSTSSGFSHSDGVTACGASLNANATCDIVVTFNPESANTYSGNLSISYNDGQQTQTANIVSLSGTAKTTASLTLAAVSGVSFGSFVVGSTPTEKAFTLTNTGGVAATSLNFGTPSGFTVTAGGSHPCGSSLAVNASCDLLVDFNPDNSGSYSSAFKVNYNNGAVTADSNTLTLTGSATYPAHLSYSESPSGDFGGFVIGQTTLTKTYTLTNDGTETATSISITVPTDFPKSGSSTCGSSLGVGNSCNIIVTFGPSSAGSFSGNLSVSYNNGISTRNMTAVALSGTAGTAASLAITADAGTSYGSLIMGQTPITKTFTVQNSGGNPATSVTFPAIDGFTISAGSPSCGSTIQAGGSCKVQVSFDATVRGSNSVSLTASYHNGVTSTTSSGLTLTGTALKPATLLMNNGLAYTFGNVANTENGSTSDATITIQNSGDLTASNFSAQQIESPYSWKGGSYPGTGGTCPTGGGSLTAGSTCTVVISFVANNNSNSCGGAVDQRLACQENITKPMTIQFNNFVENTSASLNIVVDRYWFIRSLKPVLAVRGTTCLGCHGKIYSNVLSDFGWSPDHSNGSDDFLGHSLHHYTDDGDYYSFDWNAYTDGLDSNNPVGSDLDEFTGKLYVPDAFQLRDVSSDPYNGTRDITHPFWAVSRSTTGISGIPGSGGGFMDRAYQNDSTNGVEFFKGVYIGAPTSAQIEALLPSTTEVARNDSAGIVVGFKKDASPNKDLTGIGIVANPNDSSQYGVRNTGVVECYGDLVIKGSLFFKDVQLKTGNAGCRIYLTGSFFLEGPINFVGINRSNSDDAKHIQITAAHSIIMGIGIVHYEWGDYDLLESRLGYEQPMRSTDSTSDHIRADALAFTDREDASIVHDGQDATQSSGGETRRLINFDRFIFNTPHLESRYLGRMSGVLIAEYALGSVGSFEFAFDEVLQRPDLAVFPLLPMSVPILNVVEEPNP